MDDMPKNTYNNIVIMHGPVVMTEYLGDDTVLYKLDNGNNYTIKFSDCGDGENYIGDNPAKQICYELLDYAVHWSESGNAIVYEENEDLANKVDDIIYDELDDYLLDVETYYDRHEKAWAIDCMFGGYFVPDWDGITEYFWED